MTAPRLLALLAVIAAAAARPSLGQSRPVVIRNGTLFPVDGPPLIPGTIVFHRGRITAVGSDAEVRSPAEAEVIDANGLYVTPGLIDTHSHLGVASWPSVEGNDDGSESTDPVTAQVRAADSFNLDDPAIRRAVAGGVSTVQVFPGSANLVGGEGVVVKLKVGGTLEEMLFPDAPRLMKMALGENPKSTYGRRSQMPITRMGEYAVLRDHFQRAREYRERWDRWEGEAEERRGPPPARDLGLEALAEILRGRMKVHVHCYRKDEFLNMYRLADEFGFEVTSFQHAMEAYRLPDELRARGTAVSVFSDSFGRKLEHMAHVPQNAAYLNRHGVLVSLHSDNAFRVQRLNVEAAKVVRYGGVSEEEALRMVTLNAARLIGIDGQVGSLEVGKHADLAVFDGHPLDSFSRVEKTFIDGELVFDRKRDSTWLGPSH